MFSTRHCRVVAPVREAISGASVTSVPGYRFAHPGYGWLFEETRGSALLRMRWSDYLPASSHLNRRALMVTRRPCAVSNHDASALLSSFEARPTGPREARPDDKLRRRSSR